MADMIGLTRFGMPSNAIWAMHPVEPATPKVTSAIAGVQATASGGRASVYYSALPRPVVSPQFAFANTGDPETSQPSSVIKIPEPFDVNVLTGPPPTFEATLLELEAHLRLSLARIDANRNTKPAEPKPISDLILNVPGPDDNSADRASTNQQRPIARADSPWKVSLEGNQPILSTPGNSHQKDHLGTTISAATALSADEPVGGGSAKPAIAQPVTAASPPPSVQPVTSDSPKGKAA